MSKSFSLDFSDFEKGLRRIAREVIPEVAEKAMAQAGMQLLNDCIMEPPTVPIKEGWLRGSGSVHVQNKLIAKSDQGKPGMAEETVSEPIDPGKIAARVGFNTPYAAKLHEGIGFKFSEPSAGPKYLESKLLKNKNKYFQIIADVIKAASKGGR
ncbi:MAG: hypothetical protein WC732_01875 [Candidatus Omnitrophota bacterium]